MSCMNPRTNNKRHPLYGRIAADADLGIAFLVAETEEGQYEPISPVVTINDAREIASQDMRIRMCDLERGGAPACPEAYRVWARGDRGTYSVIREFDAVTMNDVE
jgi:hypothetical protein